MPYRAVVNIQGRPNLTCDMLWPDNEDTVLLATATIALRHISDVVAAAPGELLKPTFSGWYAHRG